MAKKATQPRIMDLERGVAGSPGQIYAAVTASGPAATASPPPTDLTVIGNVIALSAQVPMAKISLQWRPPLTAQAVRGYQVQVATDSAFTTGIAYQQASDTSVDVDVVTSTAGIAYWFRVRVFSGNIVSDWSSSVTATAAADTTPAGQPTSLAWDWTGGDLILTWVNPTNTNLKDVEVRIWESASKVVLLHTGYSTTGRYPWTLPQQRIDTSGALDPAVYFELRSRTWSNTLGTATLPGTQPTNAAPSAPASVSFIQSPGSITITVSATPPSDFQAYRFRLIQTLPSASDVTWDSPSALQSYSLYAQATYQVGCRVLDVYGQLSSETLSSATIVDTLTISALRADIIYSDSDGNSDATLHVPLSNAVLGSGGITYATTATWNKWVRGERTMLDRYRIVTLSIAPASGTTSWYLRVSSDASTWTYYAGPVTSSRILTIVANAAAAQAAAISTATLGGTTTSKVVLPATIEARFVEVWVRNATPANTTIYEFYPRRLVEADDIVVQNLSSISANIGTITAGTITGATIQTATSGTRAVLDVNGLTTYDSSNVVQVTATTSTNGVLTGGAGAVKIDKNGLKVVSSSTGSLLAPVAANTIEFVTGATVDGYLANSYTLAGSGQQDMGLIATGNYVKTFSTNALNLLTMAALSVNGGSSALIQLSGENGISPAAIDFTAAFINVNGPLNGTSTGTNILKGDLRLQNSGGVARYLRLYNANGSNEVLMRDNGGAGVSSLQISPGGTLNLTVGSTTLGFFGSSGTTKPNVVGAKGGNVALANLLTVLAGLGLLTDSST